MLQCGITVEGSDSSQAVLGLNLLSALALVCVYSLFKIQLFKIVSYVLFTIISENETAQCVRNIHRMLSIY